MSRPLPVTLIGGYLGAGKTTLVNHLLRHAEGRRIGVLVNDFGRLPIDADLIRAQDGDVLELTGGCMCCSIGGDEGTAYDTLLSRAGQLDHAVIETSGVALPGSIASTLGLYVGFRLDCVAVLADAETIAERTQDAYLGDTVLAQLAAADVVVLNRIDLCGTAAMAEARVCLAAAAPQARVIEAERARVPVAVLLGLRDGKPLPHGSRFVSDHAAAYETLALTIEHAVQPAQLAAALADASLGLLRAKGHAADAAGSLWTIESVGRRHEATPAPPTLAQPGRMVCIGRAGQLDATAIARAVAGARPAIAGGD